MKHHFIFLLAIATSAAGQPSTARLVGQCEGCEAVFEYGKARLFPYDTLPDFGGEGVKMKISGTIYQPDGKTPAPGVVLYVYHTNQQGIYPTNGNEKGWDKRHGYIRGWVKTDSRGRYEFYTLKPGTYPSRNAPAHIHATILEPDGKYYYVADYHFKGDPLLKGNEAAPTAPRGGSGNVLDLRQQGNLWLAERNFVLGKNVAGYP